MVNEKRKFPRVKNQDVSLKVKTGDVDIITKSLDISASGVYCKVDKEIPLMSRIRILLVLPKVKNRDTGKEESINLETEGVVVREHPVIVDGKIVHYDIAIFFDNIAPVQREALLQYINQRTAK